MFEELIARGYQVEFHSHAKAILSVDFPDVLAELQSVLDTLTIPIEEIIGSGGGETKGTQRLRRALAASGWRKVNFEIKKTINGVPRESISHEVDHVRSFADGRMIALEIEWNNKDPFFDRDLENFKRLHAEGAISVGVIITRGRTLQSEMRTLVQRFLDRGNIAGFEDLERYLYAPTPKQKAAISKRMNRLLNPLTFRDAFTDKFVADKFGAATTHWDKLQARVDRGVGNPCPLLLIGMPASIVSFNETQAALAELAAVDDAEVDGEVDGEEA